MDVLHVVQGAEFIWDADKATSNLQRHGVAFEAASEVFFDPFVQTTRPEVRGGEYRQNATGLTAAWEVLVVAFTFRGESIRIISARFATPLQRKRYEDQHTT